MTAIAHMPDGANADGTGDDRSALQAMFDVCPAGGGCIIPDGVYNVGLNPNGQYGLRIPRPINVWCSPGAHIKGTFTDTAP